MDCELPSVNATTRREGSSTGVVRLRVRKNLWICGRGPFRRFALPPAGGIAFYVNDFPLSEPEPWRVPSESWECTGGDLIELDGPSMETTWEPLLPPVFAAAFAEAMAAIQTERLRKVVLSATERGRLRSGTTRTLVARALANPGAGVCWSYAYDDSGSGFAGVTPECLFSLCHGRLQTMALAGTARPADQAGFETDAKEAREHAFVADVLEQRLAGLGPVQRGPRQVLNIGGLLHFITRFTVATSETDITALLRLLHPTPAIGVWPSTADSRELLDRWRTQSATPRFFGAPFGVNWGGGFHAVVAIRGLFWDGRDLFLPSGCGIVEGSVWEKEWRELELKRQWIKQSMGLTG